MELPIVYLDIIERFFKSRDMGNRVTVDRARQILTMHYHFPRLRVRAILNEMKDLGLINLANCRWVFILWKPSLD